MMHVESRHRAWLPVKKKKTIAKETFVALFAVTNLLTTIIIVSNTRLIAAIVDDIDLSPERFSDSRGKRKCGGKSVR